MHWLFQFPRSYCSWRRRGLQQEGEVQPQWLAASLSPPLWSEAPTSNRAHRLPVLEFRGLFSPPWLLHTVWRLLLEHNVSLLPQGWGWERNSGSCAKSWNWPKLTAICHPRLPWKWGAFYRLQSSEIVTSDRFSRCHCLGGETDSWCF